MKTKKLLLTGLFVILIGDTTNSYAFSFPSSGWWEKMDNVFYGVELMIRNEELKTMREIVLVLS